MSHNHTKLLGNTLLALAIAICLPLGATNAVFAAEKGLLTTYTCCSDPTESSSFLNISGQLYVNVSVPVDGSCHAGAGCDWNGLNNVPFQSLTFDVQGSSSKAAIANSNFRVILDGTSGSAAQPGDGDVTFLSFHDVSSAVDLGNGWTRYSINGGAVSSANQSRTPGNVNRIIFHQYPSLTHSTSSIVFGNIVLNGDIYPVLSTTPTACPPITGDDSTAG